MSAWRHLLLLGLASAQAGCAALNYPAEPTDAEPAAREVPEAPVLLEVGFGEGAVDLATLEDAEANTARTWYALAREARIARQTRDFEEARERLAQAALQLAGRPASNAQRRAVHGMRARLALDFVALGKEEEAEALADLLFEEAENEPEIGGPATVELVQNFASKRLAEAREAGMTESPLPLLRIALDAASQDAASVQRLSLAFKVSQLATRDGDDALARRAIELALADAQTVHPSDRSQIASLQIYRARIARVQGDLAVAERAATIAYRFFDETDADPTSRAIGEAILAAILAERGDEDRARAIITGAQARISMDPPLSDHAARTVLAESARLERALGRRDDARDYFLQALDIPSVDFEPDEDLVADLTRELAALDVPSTDAAEAAASEAPPE